MRLSLILLAAAALTNASAVTLTSISGDTFGVPRQFNLIEPVLTSASSPFPLGDMTTGFTGGLAYVEGDQEYWTIYESMGQVKLASFNSSGPMSLIDTGLSLTPGLWRGLTYSPSNERFYALYSDGASPFAFQEINLAAGTVTPMFQGPAANFGGMTYVGPGQLTALFTNASGGFQLHHVDLNAQSVTPFGATFNLNMNGGLAWDTTTMARYFAIGSDNQGNSTLYGIVADGSAWGGQFSVGGGYFYSALTYHGNGVPLDDTPDSAVPEPTTLYLVSSALLVLAALSRRPLASKETRVRSGPRSGLCL